MAKSAEMPKETQIVQEIRAKAEEEGISVSESVTRLLETPGRTWTVDQILTMASALPQRTLVPTSADIIRELRGPLPEDGGDRRRCLGIEYIA